MPDPWCVRAVELFGCAVRPRQNRYVREIRLNKSHLQNPYRPIVWNNRNNLTQSNGTAVLRPPASGSAAPPAIGNQRNFVCAGLRHGGGSTARFHEDHLGETSWITRSRSGLRHGCCRMGPEPVGCS